jgi:transposase
LEVLAVLTMPGKTILEIPAAEQQQLFRQLRHWRWGYWLAVHVLLLCAAGKTPTDIAEFLFCSRTSVYRIVEAYQSGKLVDPLGQVPSAWAVVLGLGRLPQLLLGLVQQGPRAYGWCRTRWSCQTLALQLKVQSGLAVSEETVRRWLHQWGYVWKRARHVAPDNDPQRASKLARIRHLAEQVQLGYALFFADELDIALLPKIGYQWMLKGSQVEVMTPGTNQKQYLAGALDLATGQILHCTGQRKTNELFRHLLDQLEGSTRPEVRKIYVVVDNYKIHKAKAVERWLAEHRRVELVFLPSYCPKANPLERAYGDVHDNCTRNHQRQHLSELVSDVEQHFQVNGPWKYRLSNLYYAPEVETALAQLQQQGGLQAPG